MWKVINVKGLEHYSVSDKGRIKNNETNLVLKDHLLNNGYKHITLFNRDLKKSKSYSIHRLVALTFVDGDKSLIVNHKDGNKTNNIKENLEWVTYSENNSHAYRTNLRSENGEKNPSNKYKEKDIIKVCEMLEMKKYTNKEICLEVFGRWEHSLRILINDIKTRRRWKETSKNYNF